MFRELNKCCNIILKPQSSKVLELDAASVFHAHLKPRNEFTTLSRGGFWNKNFEMADKCVRAELNDWKDILSI